MPQMESYEVAPVSPEISHDLSPEHNMERSPVEFAPPQPPMPIVMPATAQPVAEPATLPQTISSSANPTAANDDDVIEMEWVHRAKQIIIQTKDSPFAREKAIAELQRDYLMKRYGRQVGASDD